MTSFPIYTLEDPAHPGQWNKYLGYQGQLFEIKTIQQPKSPFEPTSKFLGDYVESNGTYFICTPIDISFFLIPFLCQHFSFHRENSPTTSASSTPTPATSGPATDLKTTHSNSFLSLHDILHPSPLSPDQPQYSLQQPPQQQSQQQSQQPQHQSQQQQLSSQQNRANNSRHRDVGCSHFFLLLQDMDMLNSVYKALAKWCSIIQLNRSNHSTITPEQQQHDVSQHTCYLSHFRLDKAKFYQWLHRKFARVCHQLCSTNSIAPISLTISQRSDVERPVSLTNQHSSISSTNNTSSHTSSMSVQLFLSTTKSSSADVDIIFSHSFSFMREYLPLLVWESFISGFTNHLGQTYSATLLNSQKIPQPDTNYAEQKKQNEKSSSKTQAKRPRNAHTLLPGQNSLLSFLGKK